MALLFRQKSLLSASLANHNISNFAGSSHCQFMSQPTTPFPASGFFGKNPALKIKEFVSTLPSDSGLFLHSTCRPPSFITGFLKLPGINCHWDWWVWPK
jgi:hypothetical protein